MSEWLKEHAWKACVGETLPRVRIPLSPPFPHFVRSCRLERESRASRDALTRVATWLESLFLRHLTDSTARSSPCRSVPSPTCLHDSYDHDRRGVEQPNRTIEPRRAEMHVPLRRSSFGKWPRVLMTSRSWAWTLSSAWSCRSGVGRRAGTRRTERYASTRGATTRRPSETSGPTVRARTRPARHSRLVC